MLVFHLKRVPLSPYLGFLPVFVSRYYVDLLYPQYRQGGFMWCVLGPSDEVPVAIGQALQVCVFLYGCGASVGGTDSG